MKYILVTGAAGFIGSHMVDLLLAKGFKVIGVDDLSNGSRGNLKEALRHNNFTLLTYDVFNLSKAPWHDIDLVIHLAARGSVPKSIDNPDPTFINNVCATHNIALRCKEHGVRLVYASSSSVYGDAVEKYKVETLPANPLNPYAISKYVGELYCQNFHKIYGLKATGLRFFNVFGPRQKLDYDYGAVIPRLIGNAISGYTFEVYGDGEQTRDFTYVKDVCEAILGLIYASPSKIDGQVFNVCSSKSLTINYLISLLEGMLDRKIVKKYTTPRQGDIKYSLGSNDKLLKALGAWSITNTQVALSETLDFYRGKYEA